VIKMKMNNTSVNIKIVGICLIKNEDLFVERVLKNIINFCDEIIVLDNMSTDNTFEIVKRLTREYNKIKLFELEDPLKSHKFIEKYAITNTWVFGVDGDEIYDPAGLDRLRLEILLGKYQTKWQIMGNSLHCKEINLYTNKQNDLVIKIHLDVNYRDFDRKNLLRYRDLRLIFNIIYRFYNDYYIIWA